MKVEVEELNVLWESESFSKSFELGLLEEEEEEKMEVLLEGIFW